jgi:hypothetical protein
MFDSTGRLVVRNDRFVDMYGLPPEQVKPGCTLEDIIRIRKSTGNFDGDPAQYRSDLLAKMAAGKTVTFVVENPDGRVIAVTNRPIAGGNYWVGTHDDITERRLAEAQKRLACRATGTPGFGGRCHLVVSGKCRIRSGDGNRQCGRRPRHRHDAFGVRGRDLQARRRSRSHLE